jgi:hypothetical protein
MNWIYLAQNKVHWLVLVKVAMNDVECPELMGGLYRLKKVVDPWCDYLYWI